MSRLRIAALILFVALALMGCQQQEVIIPTVAQLPTITQTFTPTSTPTATFTPTLTPTATFTRTPTPTDTPTFTMTPTATLTPVDTSTFTPTFTPTLTLTPTGPEIYAFTADNYEAPAGGATVLRWSGNGESAVLDRLNAAGNLEQSWSVGATGEMAVNIPLGLGRVVTFRLTMLKNGQPFSQDIAITVTCGFNWFFGDEYAGGACPAQVGAIADGRYQAFDGGLMIYAGAGSENYPGNRVYVLAYANNQWQSYEAGGTASASGDPPDGRHFPDASALENIWQVGSFNGRPVKDVLGYSPDSSSNRDARTIQVEAGGSAVYIDVPDGRIFRLQGAVLGGWRQIK